MHISQIKRKEKIEICVQPRLSALFESRTYANSARGARFLIFNALTPQRPNPLSPPYQGETLVRGTYERAA